MKLLDKSPGEITVKSTIDIQSAAGGLFIQACILFALIYVIWMFFTDETGKVKIYFILFLLALNVVCYYISLHSQITKNINRVHISSEGITRSTPLKKYIYPAHDIEKAVLSYTFIKGSRGSENTHIVELLTDLKDGSTITAFYMENMYWEDQQYAVYNDIIETLISCNYCSKEDYKE